MMHTMFNIVLTALLLLTVQTPSPTQALPRGQIADAVACAGDPSQSYSLYLPSDYSDDRAWPLLMGFHPAGRGRAIVETYQAAAEKYGYIVVASNNSRNGPWEVSAKAITAMTGDVSRRFKIAAGRYYMTGHSGGSRVALQVALASKKIDGVIASSAGYPDSQPRKSVPFVIYGTAGTEDFNYIEMKLLGRELKTPHHIVIFEGGHTLPPVPVATQAIEWLEVQAMAVGTRVKDLALVERLYGAAVAAAEQLTSPAEQAEALEAVVADFAGVRDVSALKARVDALANDKDTKKVLSQRRSSDFAEARLMNELIELEAGIPDETTRAVSLARLRDTLSKAYKQATAPEDSPQRQQSRRVIRAITAGSIERVQDPEYRKMLEGFRLPSTGRGRS